MSMRVHVLRFDDDGLQLENPPLGLVAAVRPITTVDRSLFPDRDHGIHTINDFQRNFFLEASLVRGSTGSFVTQLPGGRS